MSTNKSSMQSSEPAWSGGDLSSSVSSSSHPCASHPIAGTPIDHNTNRIDLSEHDAVVVPNIDAYLHSSTAGVLAKDLNR